MSDPSTDPLAILGGAVVAGLAALWAAIRRRRRRKGSFRPRARFRGYFSMRTHRGDSDAPASLEPGPFDDERDTGRHHKPRGSDDE
jgi:hypothetical protein